MNPRSIFGEVFSTESIIAACVFAAVLLALLVTMVLSRRRKRRGAGSSDRMENNPLEITYGLLVAAVAGFVIWLSLHTTHEERASAAPAPAAVVNVTAYRWCWRFDYPGHGISVNGTCNHFHDEPVMVVPAGVPVQVRIRSQDVIHSWFVPDLRYKLDAFPDHVNTVTLTVSHEGEWQGRCAEYCGDYHYSMDFKLRAVSPQKYRQWLASTAGAAA